MHAVHAQCVSGNAFCLVLLGCPVVLAASGEFPGRVVHSAGGIVMPVAVCHTDNAATCGSCVGPVFIRKCVQLHCWFWSGCWAPPGVRAVGGRANGNSAAGPQGNLVRLVGVYGQLSYGSVLLVTTNSVFNALSLKGERHLCHRC